MAGIAGILKGGQKTQVEQMLGIISHRGKDGKKTLELPDATIGIVWSSPEAESVQNQLLEKCVIDGPGYGQQASVKVEDKKISLYRDELGVSPLYYAKTNDGSICFASEVKALLALSNDIYELAPGHILSESTPQKYFELKEKEPYGDDPKIIALELRKRLETVIRRRIKGEVFGSWLSGGLDSSIIAAIARPFVKTLYTFTTGIKDAPDIIYAREAANFIGSQHKEVIIEMKEMLRLLPEVIYHLESFDALLVRSSILNYIAAKAASEYVSEVFSGEAGDEFFAGYLYLKSLPHNDLDAELIDISKRLHNTAFQRVDRSAASHGTKAHVVFADPEVFNYALGIPVGIKLYKGIEKWILRQAVVEILPDTVLNRTKAKFWEGSGVRNMLFDYAFQNITDKDFRQERNLENGWILNTKEELLYYRVFKETFGKLNNLDWMGRTKGMSRPFPPTDH